MTSRRAQRRRDLERQAPTRVGLARVAGGVASDQVAIAGLTREAEDVGRHLAELLEGDAGRGLVGWGRAQRLHVERATVGPELEARPPAIPGGCFENAALYTLGHRDLPGLVLTHGLIVEEGRLLPHSFVLVGGGVIFDPTVSGFFVEASYRSVLGATVVCEHPSGEVASRVLEGGGPGPWGDCDERYTRVREALMDGFDAAHPDLAAWAGEMLDRDPVFRGQFQEAAGRGGWAVLNMMLDLARDGRWRDHEPGSRPWPHGFRLPAVAGAR